jgi:translin
LRDDALLMKGLSDNISSVNGRMEALEADREKAISESRGIIRSTKRIIHSIHLSEPYEDLLRATEEDMRRLAESIDPRIASSGPVQDAMAELAEASLFHSIMTEGMLPSHSSLGISPQAWVLGLADCLGEMRRALLDMLMEGDTERAGALFSEMEEICGEIMLFDVPDAILPIRRKQDVARGLMEKTRTDLANAVVMARVTSERMR